MSASQGTPARNSSSRRASTLRSCTTLRIRPESTSKPTTTGIAREKRASTSTPAASSCLSAVHNGASAPIHKVAVTACRKTVGRVRATGEAVAAWPALAAANPTQARAAHASRPAIRPDVGDCMDAQARASAVAPIRVARPKLVAKSPASQTSARNSADIGSPSASRP